MKSQITSIFFDYNYLLSVDSQSFAKQFDEFVFFFFDVFSVSKILTRKLSKNEIS